MRVAISSSRAVVIAAILLLLCSASAFAQGTIIPFVTQQFLDASGNPVNNGKLCSYAAGTVTPLATYSDVTLMTANANPIRTSSNGRPTTGAIYLSSTAYKFELRTAGTDNTCATGTVLWTLDNVSAVPTSSGNVDVTGTAGETLTAGDVVYLSDGSGSLTAGRFYKADADFTYASSQAGIIGIATAAITSGNTGTIRLAGQFSALSGLAAGATYYISATAGALTATAPSNARFVGQAISTTTIDFASNPWPVVIQPLAIAEGRLTLTSGMPVTSGDVTAATSVYYAPYKGNRIALYNGAAWNIRFFTEIAINISACTASRPYDVFLYDNAGTVTAETLVWTSATARATALTTQDGVYVKTGALTRRYVGTFYCNGTGGQTDDTYAKRYVWNYYNRVPRPFRVLESTDTWTYTTASYRQANNSAANQVAVMVGVAEVPVQVEVFALAENNNADVNRNVSIGEDSTTTPATGVLMSGRTGTVPATDRRPVTASLNTMPAVGYHFYAWLEFSTATGTTTWVGDGGLPTLVQSGMVGWIEG